MRPFTLERPHDLATAIAFGAADGERTDYIAGGTDMMQLLTDDIRWPGRLVALDDGVLDDRIELGPDGTLRLGAAARMSDVADHPAVRDGFPVISEALLLSASPQVRNMATVGGNLLQRTRCSYFRDPGVPNCNKRSPGTGCAALDGVNRMLAVLGGSEHCIATHASDFAVPLVALGARVRLSGPGGERTLPVADLHRLPGDTPHVETVLAPGELITAIEVPASRAARTSHYLKVRDRASFEFALVSAAVAVDVDGDRIREARVAMGGVGTKPWRMRGVEQALAGARCDLTTFRSAAARAADGAQPRPGNAFKPELMRRAVLRALRTVGGRP
ncbi:FAD binding domain-containing protein [Marinactinospora rubrisoli]|uniref:FAD binding domain-containing protein n=1 Tax=Marinactinospora rubrisoli TaxID=2715399 RepID=A0ABW2KEA3_9ACTN